MLSSFLLAQLPFYLMVVISTLLSLIYLKHVKTLFAAAATIRHGMISAITEACVVGVGLAILTADYYALHAAEAVARASVQSPSIEVAIPPRTQSVCVPATPVMITTQR